ncbi:MAG: hypothetical protein U9P81_05865 [Euryarchaeota archaeon]|nr:hypothetical protein [Euryarchaeota archaeon]
MEIQNPCRHYDMEEHAVSLMEYLRIQKKNSDFVLPWSCGSAAHKIDNKVEQMRNID